MGAALVLVAGRTGFGQHRLRLGTAVVLGLVLLAGPTAYSLSTVGRDVGGSNPLAGPIGGPELTIVDPPPLRRFASVTAPRGDLGARAERELLAFLVEHRARRRFLVAASGTAVAAPLILAGRAPVITLGGFAGSDPVPAVEQLRRLVHAGRVRYFVAELTRPTGSSGDAGRRRWLARRCHVLRYSAGPLPLLPDQRLALFDCAGAG